MTHTPGPWRVSSTGRNVQAQFRHTSAGGQLVEYWSDIAATASQGAGKAQRLANARLMAAAPDLLSYTKLMAANGDPDAIELVAQAEGCALTGGEQGTAS